MIRRFSRSCCKLYIPNCNETEERPMLEHRTVNKQKFINVLHDALKRTDCTILHAKGDADVLIVETTVESAKTADTILVMDDTELLILLWYYADIHSKGLYLKPEPRQNTKTPRIWDIMKQKCIR